MSGRIPRVARAVLAGMLAGSVVAGVTVQGDAAPASAEPVWKDADTGLRARGAPLALDRGRPRFLYGADDSLRFAWCDRECHRPSSWRTTRLRDDTTLRGLDIAIDAWGRVHVAYLDLARQGVFYSVCDLDCGQAGSWSHAKVDDTTSHHGLSLRVDPWGRPRLTYVAFPDRRLTYAACDRECGSADGWSTLVIYQHRGSLPSMDLDGGKPRIVYPTSGSAGRNELRYLSCEARCLERPSWQEATVVSFPSSQYPGNPSLVIEGPRAHIAFDQNGAFVSVHAGAPWLGYVRCEGNCSQASNWSQPVVVAAHASMGTRAKLAVVDGRPRIAYEHCENCFKPGQQSHLTYAWCDTQCASQANNGWTVRRITTPGTSVHLALDGERPRIVYERQHAGIAQPGPTYYTWCDAPCGRAGTGPSPPPSPPPDDSSASPPTSTPPGPGAEGSSAVDGESGRGTTGGAGASSADEQDGSGDGSGLGGATPKGDVDHLSPSGSARAGDETAETEALGRADRGSAGNTEIERRKAGSKEHGGVSTDDTARGIARLPGSAVEVLRDPARVLTWPWSRIALSLLAVGLLGLVSRWLYVEGTERWSQRWPRERRR